MNEILTYKQATPYIRRTKKMLKSILSVESFISDTKSDLLEIEKLEKEQGKKRAILCFYKNARCNYEREFDSYMEKMNIALKRAEKLYNRIYSAMNTIQNDVTKGVIETYYIHGLKIDETAEKFSYSISSICRYKKVGLAKMTEQLFGVIIEEKNVNKKYYANEENAG